VLEPTSLHAVVKGALERVRSTWPERAELWVDVPESLPQVAAAASDLEQVVVNLLLNARDAVGLTGSVRLQARPFQTPDGAMGVVCAIEDDGPGVALDAREHIFTPFFTTKARREGAGLGLAVAHQILREHHGRLWLEDRPGGGARFCFALHGAHTLNAATEPPVEGQLLYVVDDEETLREGWAGALRRRGYIVRTFDNGSVAAEALAAGAPHALITDVLLPGMNGLELTTLCRALHPDVPVLIVSGYIPDDTLPPDSRIHRLDKPIRTSRLVATVGRILTGSASATDDAGPRVILPTLDAVTWESATWGTPSLPPSRLGGVPAALNRRAGGLRRRRAHGPGAACGRRLIGAQARRAGTAIRRSSSTTHALSSRPYTQPVSSPMTHGSPPRSTRTWPRTASWPKMTGGPS
jgi:CheY-like chemotaxis protein